MAPHSAAVEIAEASNVTGARSGYRAQQLTPMAQGGHSELFKVLVGQVSQDGKVDVILSKALSVLPETELPKPVRNLLHRGDHHHRNSRRLCWAGLRADRRVPR